VLPDEYREPTGKGLAELKIKGSRFIARVFPVDSRDQARGELESVRKQYYDATHHCSAFRIGPESRFHDDGEPSGTAGKPILKQIEGADLTNTLVVVTRYYGGTKLGTGGLARAYGGAAAEALRSVEIATRIRRTRITVCFDYADTSPAMFTISRFDIKIDDSVYGDRTELRLLIRQSEVERFSEAFVDALGGRGQVLEGQPGTSR
jgi:uncharacterized YigZ family protein